MQIRNSDVLAFSQDGKGVKTEKVVQPGSDGIVVMPDGTKYVSSVREGGVSGLRPTRPRSLIARTFGTRRRCCCDAGANQLVIPMNANKGMAFIRLK